MGKTLMITGTEPRSGCSWTYTAKVLTITTRPDRADSDAIWRIVADQLHLVGEAEQITVVRRGVALTYRVPAKAPPLDDKAPPPLEDDVDDTASAHRRPEPPSPCRKRRTRHAKG